MQDSEGNKDSCTKVTVRNPITHNTWEEGKFTTYEINIETNDIMFSVQKSSVRRRYSEFSWLRSQLQKYYPNVDPPSLPPKRYFSRRYDTDVLEERTEGLQTFLENLFKEVKFMADSTVHLFVQSQTSIPDILECLQGKTEKGVIETIVEYNKPPNAVVRDIPDGNAPLSALKQNNPYVGGSWNLQLEVSSTSGSEASSPFDIFSPTRPKTPLGNPADSMFIPHTTDAVIIEQNSQASNVNAFTAEIEPFDGSKNISDEKSNDKVNFNESKLPDKCQNEITSCTTNDKEGNMVDETLGKKIDSLTLGGSADRVEEGISSAQ